MHLGFLAAAVLNTYVPLRVRGYGDPGSFLLSPTSEGNQLEVKCPGPVGQQLVTRLALTRVLWLLQTCDPLRGLRISRRWDPLHQIGQKYLHQQAKSSWD